MKGLILLFAWSFSQLLIAENESHRLYVATPGIRNQLEWGGHGVLVFDIDHGHKFLRRIPFGGLDEKGVPRNVKGICAHAATKLRARDHALRAIRSAIEANAGVALSAAT